MAFCQFRWQNVPLPKKNEAQAMAQITDIASAKWQIWQGAERQKGRMAEWQTGRKAERQKGRNVPEWQRNLAEKAYGCLV